MSIDEKLGEISNLIEYMLNKEGKFIKLAYSRTCFNYITDDVVIDYRKKNIALGILQMKQ